MYLFTLLAFYFHQIFELTDGLYQACRVRFGSKRYMRESLRGDIRRMIFDSLEVLMDFELNPDKWEVTKVRKPKKNLTYGYCIVQLDSCLQFR